ncbi:uncharacterized protein LAESUDRAFT_673310 [Laetiporus sulphureus 93-53]|uniref:MYND-type domain-containing protein n=1 Tax=Laetiporus sulphureus 93-53 TaxID=1314785 RepID=A0A165GLL0_9APHY|nr:uncharacterized protein LAESUDRAFT_673310 [Laetiporus sulphureus 93-53]KZT10520.1 hypothetical protein LAESUDRAFT_673310 [Laetiporus sulphureus 93-53]
MKGAILIRGPQQRLRSLPVYTRGVATHGYTSHAGTPGKPIADLRDKLAFPSYENCPGEHSIDDRYLRVQGAVATRKRHWCYFGEVVDYMVFGRVHLHVRDASGRVVLASFYDDEDRGSRYLKGGRLQKGDTMAHLYPFRHQFFDGQVGFRMESTNQVKIIPCTLNDLRLANDKLQTSLPITCWAPGCSNKEDLQLCNKCKTARYCVPEHQTKAWQRKHEQECQALRELSWFLSRDWTTFKSRFSF